MSPHLQRVWFRTAVASVAVLLACTATSCRLGPAAPVGLTADALMSPASTGEGAAGDAAFLGVRISRRGERVGIAVEFAPGRAAGRIDADGGTARGSCLLAFDTDQREDTGGFSGEECSFLVRDGRVEIRRLEQGAWTLVESGTAVVTPARIAFDVPAELLGDDLWVNWTLELHEWSGNGWGIAALHRGSNHPAPSPTACVPSVSGLTAEVRRGAVHVQGLLSPRRGSRAPHVYDPERAGGWALQVLLDTDGAGTGYWLGYDYIVRGVEWADGGRSFVVRRITLEEGYPGGWGPQSGVARFRDGRYRFDIEIPLEAIGGGDGRVSYVLETYATVDCAECESGISHHWAGDYFGACDGGGGWVAAGIGRMADASGLRPIAAAARGSAASRVLARGTIDRR
jgi:hypothetical protein